MKLEWLAGDTGCPGPSCQEEIAKPGLAAERCRLRQPSSPSKGSGGSLKLAELGPSCPWAVDASCLPRHHPSALASLCPGIIPLLQPRRGAGSALHGSGSGSGLGSAPGLRSGFFLPVEGRVHRSPSGFARL